LEEVMAEWSQNLPGYYRVVVWFRTPASQKIFDPRLLQQERKKERKKVWGPILSQGSNFTALN